MAIATATSLQVVLKYDEGTYSYKNIALNAANDKLFALANLLNKFQEDPVTKISVRKTKVVM